MKVELATDDEIERQPWPVVDSEGDNDFKDLAKGSDVRHRFQ